MCNCSTYAMLAYVTTVQITQSATGVRYQQIFQKRVGGDNVKKCMSSENFFTP